MMNYPEYKKKYKDGILRKKLRKWIMPMRRGLALRHCNKRYNLNQLQSFEAALNRHDRSLCNFKSILDFGCGYGRHTRYLFKIAQRAQILGCDTNPLLVEECRRKFPHGAFVRNNSTPPLDLGIQKFDLIYSYSVFTHLSESNHLAWLRELASKLKFGGIMMHTTHSYETLRRLEVFSPRDLKKYRLPEPLVSFVQSPERYHYVVNDPSKPEYGYTIISKGYVMKKWAEYSGLTIVDYIEGAIESYPEGCHDIVMLINDSR